MPTFADLLLEHRLARGLSQQELAEQAGVSPRAIGDMERGATRRPQRGTLLALAGALDLDEPAQQAFLASARRDPPRSSHSVRRHDLPAPATPIIGRQSEVTALSRLLRGFTRLVTITGPGGVGKSRLALEAALRVAHRFDRAALVDLSGVAAAADVPAALAGALDPSARGREPTVDALAAELARGSSLLLLDTFEHLTDAAGIVGELLARCPELHLVVTSRTPLQLRAEHRWPLEPLAVPSEELCRRDDPATLDALRATPAVTLLVQRAAAVCAGFALDARNAGALGTLCRRLDGLPLAVELAAAQLRTLDPQTLLGLLDERLPFLRAEAIDVPDRQRTLRAVVEWSADRLTAADREVLAALGAFRGGVHPEQLAAVLERAQRPVPVLDASVGALVATGLLSTRVDRAGRPRLEMLDGVRAVARTLLDESGPVGAAVLRAHADRFLELAGADGDPDRLELTVELDNLTAAAEHATGHAPELLGRPAVAALHKVLFARGLLGRARRLMSAVAEAATDPATRGAAWVAAAIAANEAVDHADALRMADAATAEFGAVGSALGLAQVATLRGAVHRALGDLEAAERAFTECVDLATEISDERMQVIARNNLGILAQDRGELDTARAHYRLSLEVKRRRGDRRGCAVALSNLCSVDVDSGEFERTRPLLDEALAQWRELDEPHPMVLTLCHLVDVQLGLDDPAAAEATCTEALRYAERAERPAVAMVHSRLGDLFAHRGELTTAAEHYAQACPDIRDGLAERLRARERLAAVLERLDPPRAAELHAEIADDRRAQRVVRHRAQQRWLDAFAERG